ncbi:hypothetical protein C0Z18_18515 [Trinickia dabaoshanensis]|uniref:Uncharacterized protein n=1 Tax=Trinickia dabaoshanensis TaxID=564714 RepID=A0A2N7VKZ9_9BURK|nr:hypothetical protein [Trinickia dabaoshanensis]PMS17841.1 hypothetical protein C0Z18_18515 [Trinickia dabaoshanensis]
MSASTPIVWNDPSTAVTLLAPLIVDNGINNVLVKCDPASPHYGQGPKYRQARFALDGGGNAWWIDAASGLPLYNCVVGFALGE